MKKLSAMVASPFDLLTEEIVMAILDRLDDNPLAKKSFSRVCKGFYAMEARHRRTLRALKSDLILGALKRYPFITYLDLTLCPIVDDATLTQVALEMKGRLLSIDLSKLRGWTHVGLASLVTNCAGLVEIDLSNQTELNDSALKFLAEAKNLERLGLARCKKVTDMGIGCVAVGCRKLRFLCLKWCLRVSDLGVGLIAMKCKEIRSLDLSYLPITDKCLTPILQLEHLEDLVLEGCPGIDDDGLATLKHSCKSLKTLNMSNCQNISHVGLSSLTNGANGLQQLILAYGPAVNEDLAICMNNISRLQSVRIDGCTVTTSAIKTIGNWLASLKELSLSKCLGVTDECLSFLVQKHKELRKLDITCCRKITYASIASITKSCSFLTSLRMESCSLISRDAFVLIGQHCRLLEELDATDNEIDNEGLKSISRCSKLVTLKLGICLNITDDGLTHVARACSMLKELDLYRSAGITDASIAAIAHGCPALEMINVSYNETITDNSLISLSKCRLLKALEIRGCPSVSSMGLSAIAKECRQLAVLDIKKCFNINDNGMIPLAKFSHNLKQINLSYCSVTDAGLLALASTNQLRYMTILHLAGLTPNGLAGALLASQGLTKVKLHKSFRPLLPPSIFEFMEARGCIFHWRDKAFQVEIDPKRWELHNARSPGA